MSVPLQQLANAQTSSNGEQLPRLLSAATIALDYRTSASCGMDPSLTGYYSSGSQQAPECNAVFECTDNSEEHRAPTYYQPRECQDCGISEFGVGLQDALVYLESVRNETVDASELLPKYTTPSDAIANHTDLTLD